MATRNTLLLAALVLAGCQTVAPESPPKQPPVELTLSWTKQDRGGAAESTPGYVHVLHRGGPVYRPAPENTVSDAAVLSPPAPPSIADIPPPAANTAFAPTQVQPPTPSATHVVPRNVPNNTLPGTYNSSLSPVTLAGITAVTTGTAAPSPVVIDAVPQVQVVATEPAPANDPLREAWVKYCDGAREMTDAQWQLVREAGAPENVPPDLANNCIHPK